MDALVAYDSDSEGSDNGGEQPQKQKQASHEEGEIGNEIPVSETSTMTTMDLPPSSHVPLPLELNCEIFKCLKLPIQRKFIWGLGRDIYGMFRQKLLKKTKRVRNPHGNRWNRTNTRVTIEADGLYAANLVGGYPNIFAEQPFPISGPHCRLDEFPGTICYYYEIKSHMHMWGHIGLSDGAIPDPHLWIGYYLNSYAILADDYCPDRCWLAGEPHDLEFPVGAIRPRWKDDGMDVYGCGLVLDPHDKWAIFFHFEWQAHGCSRSPASEYSSVSAA